jgi:transcriptional regulator with XRE-family HTH domain
VTDDLRRRFGSLVGAHRRRRGLTQEGLAQAADVSVDMVGKIEAGTSGARFPVIARLATALDVDPAEFFTTEFAGGKLRRGPLMELSTRLAALSDAQILWIDGIVDAALLPLETQRSSSSSGSSGPARSVGGRRRSK